MLKLPETLWLLQLLNSLVVRYTKLQRFFSLLNLEIPQKTSSYENSWQFVFPEIDAACREDKLKQLEETKSSGL